MSQDTFNPFADPVLSAYLANVRAWHGYIRFLGLPHLRENPDVVIDRLYVEPRLADRYTSPDSPPKDWPETKTTLEVVPEHRRLVLLGDPGSGKSTLIKLLSGLLSDDAQPWQVEGILRHGVHIYDLSRDRCDIGALVFQNYALFPHLTVRDNIEHIKRTHRVKPPIWRMSKRPLPSNIASS